jgi:hypothetical protein
VTVDDEHAQLLKALTVERYRRPAPRKAVTVRSADPASPEALADLVDAVNPPQSGTHAGVDEMSRVDATASHSRGLRAVPS